MNLLKRFSVVSSRIYRSTAQSGFLPLPDVGWRITAPRQAGPAASPAGTVPGAEASSRAERDVAADERAATEAMMRALLLAGGACILVVVLTHVAEVLPGMGWGLPDSPGHYLDLFSAASGIVLLLAAYIVRRQRRRSARR